MKARATPCLAENNAKLFSDLIDGLRATYGHESTTAIMASALENADLQWSAGETLGACGREGPAPTTSNCSR